MKLTFTIEVESTGDITPQAVHDNIYLALLHRIEDVGLSADDDRGHIKTMRVSATDDNPTPRTCPMIWNSCIQS